MAFFDKISAAAKSAKESANTAIEIGKLNLKIKSENDSIEQFKGQIGDLLWSQYLAGTVTDPQVLALCESIAAANSNIEALQQQVDNQGKIDDISVPLERDHGVQLMTIHKSKGLEFPVVFLVNSNARPKTNQNDDAVYLHQQIGRASCRERV